MNLAYDSLRQKRQFSHVNIGAHLDKFRQGIILDSSDCLNLGISPLLSGKDFWGKMTLGGKFNFEMKHNARNK